MINRRCSAVFLPIFRIATFYRHFLSPLFIATFQNRFLLLWKFPILQRLLDQLPIADTTLKFDQQRQILLIPSGYASVESGIDKTLILPIEGLHVFW